MKINGKTTDGKNVMGDVFKFVGTHGLPLEILLYFLSERNMVIDWVEYIQSALRDGHRLQTIRSRIIAAIGDVFGAKYRIGFEEKLNILIGDKQ